MRFLVPVLCALLAQGCATTSGTSGAASDFTLNAVEGRAISLSEHLGKDVVVLDFMATWCGPCTQQLPHLQKLYETYRANGFVVLGVSMDGPETISNVGPYVRRHGVTFPVLLDEDTRVTSIYNPRRAAPLTVFIDRNGRLAGVREGFLQGDEQEVEKTVRGLLGLDAQAAVVTAP